MRIITRKDSFTGLQFQQIVDRIDIIKSQARVLSQELGFTNFKQSINPAYGEILLVAFATHPDKMLWARKGEGWYPRQNTRGGRDIIALLRSIEPIPQTEITHAVFPINNIPSKANIGYTLGHADYFGFTLLDEWYDHTPIPDDCEEVILTAYRQLFYPPPPLLEL